MKQRSKCAHQSVTIAAIAAVVCGQAAASPRSDPSAGEATFTGAASAHPTGTWLNPATMIYGSAATLYVGGSALFDRVSVQTSETDATINTLNPGLDLVGSYHVVENIAIGVHLSTPPAEEFFAAPNRTLRFASLGGTQRDYVATLSSAAKLGDRITIGVSGIIGHKRLQMRFSRDTALANAEDPARGINSQCGTNVCGIGNELAAEDYNIKASTSALEATSITIGALVRFGRATYVGLAYHTPPGFSVTTELVGSSTVVRAARDGGETLQGRSQITASFPASIDFAVRTPLSSRWEGVIGGRWQDLSRLAAYDVRPFGQDLAAAEVPDWIRRPRGFDDSFGLWAGGEMIDDGRLVRVGARIGLQTSALDDSRTTSANVSPTAGLANAALQLRVAPGWSLALHAGVRAYLPVNVAQGASAYNPNDYIVCAQSEFDYNNSACRQTREGYAAFDGAGRYSRLTLFSRFGLRYDF